MTTEITSTATESNGMHVWKGTYRTAHVSLGNGDDPGALFDHHLSFEAKNKWSFFLSNLGINKLFSI